MLKPNAPFLYAMLSFILVELSTGGWRTVWSIFTVVWCLMFLAGLIIEHLERKTP